MNSEVPKNCVDCDEGRRLGCQTFCCRLLVRLQQDEIDARTKDGSAPKSLVDKDPDGLCVHFDRETNLCGIWETRPYTCRMYECNSDFLLQVVIREGFVNIVESARAANSAYIPKETFVKIPLVDAGQG